MLAAADHVKSPVNVLLRAQKDISDAIEIRQQRQRNGQFRVIGMVQAIVFEPDRDFNPELAPRNAKLVGRRLDWPENGPWLARTYPENDLIFTAYLRLPLPEVPDVARDDPGRLPIGDHSDPIGKPNLWKPGDPVNTAPMMKQEMERVASAKFGPFLVFQPVAQIQIVAAGRGRQMPEMMGRSLVGGGVVGNVEGGSLGSHRMPLSSLHGMGDTVMALLIDPKTGEALFVGGHYRGVEMK